MDRMTDCRSVSDMARSFDSKEEPGLIPPATAPGLWAGTGMSTARPRLPLWALSARQAAEALQSDDIARRSRWALRQVAEDSSWGFNATSFDRHGFGATTPTSDATRRACSEDEARAFAQPRAGVRR